MAVKPLNGRISAIWRARKVVEVSTDRSAPPDLESKSFLRRYFHAGCAHRQTCASWEIRGYRPPKACEKGFTYMGGYRHLRLSKNGFNILNRLVQFRYWLCWARHAMLQYGSLVLHLENVGLMYVHSPKRGPYNQSRSPPSAGFWWFISHTPPKWRTR